MEFDEINALINIERKNYQNDLKHGRISNITQIPHSISQISHSIKQNKQQIQQERAAMEHVKQCTRQVQYALQQLNTAMAAHAAQLKATAAASF